MRRFRRATVRAMSVVTPEETEALARLAKLSLGEDERETFAGQLGRILAYIDTLQRVDVADVPEYVGEPQRAVGLREDLLGSMLGVDEALAGVPLTREDQVAVPKFKED